MDGQRVEELVGENRTGLRTRPERLEPVGEPEVAEAPPERLEPRAGDVHWLVAERLEQVRRGPAQTVQDSLGEGTASGAMLADDEPRRPPERNPDRLEMASDRPAEDRMALGRGEEVA